MTLFYGMSILDFTDKFKTDEDCIKYLYKLKFNNGFHCSKCNHTHSWKGVKPYTKVCKQCRHVESATSNTLFHKVKFGLRKAFIIVFEMSTTTKSMSANQMSKRLKIRYKAAWLFMRKVRQSMFPPNDTDNKLSGDVIVDEFVVGGYEKGSVGRKTKSKKKMKVIVAIETHKKIGVKKAYMLTIKDYSTKELKRIFDKYVSTSANVLTDKWRGYLPLKEEYNLKQIESAKRKNFAPMNRYIQGLKSWIRGIHHSVKKYHLQAYLNEYSYRMNNHLHKAELFQETVERMLESKVYNRMMLSNCKLMTYKQRKDKIIVELAAKGELLKAA